MSNALGARFNSDEFSLFVTEESRFAKTSGVEGTDLHSDTDCLGRASLDSWAVILEFFSSSRHTACKRSPVACR